MKTHRYQFDTKMFKFLFKKKVFDVEEAFNHNSFMNNHSMKLKFVAANGGWKLMGN